MRRERNCDFCGEVYIAKMPNSRFCRGSCRVRNHQAKVLDQQVKAVLAGETVEIVDGEEVSVVPKYVPPVDLVSITRRTLEDANKLETVAGQQALRLAEAMCGRETGAGLASLSKALTTVMEEIAGGTSVADDMLDELRARRERRRAG